MSQPYSQDSDLDPAFRTTCWSTVRRSLASHHGDGQKALTQLCQIYWPPVYAFIRRSGYRPHDAEDLTQGFFFRMIEQRFLSVADHEKGKLRTFLLTCVKRHLSDEAEKGRAQKRGGGVAVISLSQELEEKRLAEEAVDRMSPDRLFQRRWALRVLETTMQLLKKQYQLQGKELLFDAVSPFLGFSQDAASYEATATRLGMNLNTVKSHVRRLRQHWREILMQQVASTLDNPTTDNIKAELAELTGWV